MTDLKSFGYTRKAKTFLFDRIRNITLLTLSVLTFLILLFRLSNDTSLNKENINSEASENKKSTQINEESIVLKKYHSNQDSLELKPDTCKLVQKKTINK